jgi:hypothetical protein
MYICIVKYDPKTYRLRDCAEHFLHLSDLRLILQVDGSVEVRHLRATDVRVQNRRG